MCWKCFSSAYILAWLYSKRNLTCLSDSLHFYQNVHYLAGKRTNIIGIDICAVCFSYYELILAQSDCEKLIVYLHAAVPIILIQDLNHLLFWKIPELLLSSLSVLVSDHDFGDV